MKIIKDKNEWERILKNFEKIDVFYTYDFMKVNCVIEPGYPESIYFEDENLRFFYPYIRRPLSDLPYVPDKYKEYSDITAPYGVGGPLFEGDVKKILPKIKEFFMDSKTISEFVRFHPLIENYRGLEDFYELIKISPIVYIDFNDFENIKDIFKSFRENVRRNIKYAEKMSYKCVISNKKEDIVKFYNVYINTMKLKGGEKRHFFPFDYFEKFSLASFSYFYFVYYKDILLSGGLFLISDEFSTYLFGGVSEEGYKTKGSTHFLFWNFIKEKFGSIDYLILGGGRGKEDSLLHFKRGFSKKEKPYFITRKIYFKEIYENLVSEFLKYKGIKKRPTLFPQYREI